MNELPRNIYFFWGNEKISFMRYMTFYSCRKLNPSWNIILIKRKKPISDKEWNREHKFIPFIGKDYSKELEQLNLKIEYLEEQYPRIAELNLSNVHTSDLLGWYILGYKGGIVADTDILFIKPIPYKDADIGLISFKDKPLKDYTPVSIMMGKPNDFFKKMYISARKKILDKDIKYESLGSPLIKEIFGSFENIKEKFKELNVQKLPSKFVFPFSEEYSHKDYARLTFGECNLNKLDKDCIGIHWYGGIPYTQVYDNLITHRNFNKFRNTISEAISKTYTQRVSIVQCVSTALDMLKFSTDSLIKNSGHSEFDYIVVIWNASKEVKDYLKELQELYDFVYVVEYKTNKEVGYVPNLRGMMNKGFDYGFKLNNYCGLVNTDMYFGRDWLKNLVRYINENEIVNSVHITAFMKRSNVITENLGHTTYGQFNHKRFDELYKELYKNELEREGNGKNWIDLNTLPYLFHKKWWDLCGPWELKLGKPDSPDVRFFRRCSEAGAKFTKSHSSIVYHYQAVERSGKRPPGTQSMVNED